MRPFAAGFRLQVQLLRADPDLLLPLATAPVFAVVFLAIVEHAGRSDLVASAFVAPVLIALWSLAVMDSAEIVEADRLERVLEPLVSTPASLPAIVLGRIAALTAPAVLAFGEVWLVARLGFGAKVVFHHPWTFLAASVATALASAATAVVLASVFVLARSARTFQNALSFPFYVVGGVLAPVSLLPHWLRPLSSAVYLSWSADLMRDALAPASVERVAPRLAAILGLAAAAFALGTLLFALVLRRLRVDGTLDVV